MSRTIGLSSPAMPLLLGEPALVISKLVGEEALSLLYSYLVTAKTPANPLIPWQAASNVDLKALIGKEMTVEIELDGNGLGDILNIGKSVREISGIVQKARYVGRDGNQALYEICLRPWLHLAELTADYKIFQQKSVVDIIDEVLADYSFTYEKRLAGSYPLLDFQVQYGETDFDFIERLMEEWGIYWFFEHSEKSHKLILVDNVGTHKRFTSEAYHVIQYAPDRPKMDQEYISQFHFEETITSGKWVTNDYDFTKSRADIMAIDSKPRKTSFNQMEIFHWPGDYEQPAIGEQLARVRMEERGALGSRCNGSGELRGIACGCVFELVNYPVEKANREYMILRSKLEVEEIAQLTSTDEFRYTCHFTVQPTTKIYRHPMIIEKPKTSGPQTAIVVGPEGEDIWTDEYGRVKVRFLWDRYGQNRESDSCWMRVSQAWAGNNFGGIYIPRVGHEVIVDFINGDPDRPLITGNLYNNVTMPPWELPVNATQSGLISRTVGGGRSNYNGIRFEDKPGQEEYWEQAERNMTRLTKQNEEQTIGLNSSINVGVSRNLFVGGNYMSDVIGNSSALVGASLGIQVGGSQSDSVGGAKGINVGGAFMTNVGGYHSVSVGGASAMVAGGALMQTAGGAMTLTAGGELVISAKKIKIIGSSQVIIQGGEVDINPGDSCCDSCGGGGGGGGAMVGLPGLPMITSLMGVVIPLPPMPTPTPPTPTPPTPSPTPSWDIDP
ncbi:type VI secretion system Vgr family protein [Pantoea agglomerans]|uniref:type VI secretion system Vgr family protein n=1 Tax=Enterobacter agglomerans TaxID=549 RepID=UPI001F5B7725|nr:type VI secretion system tip protein TssI/VgrG [Pantoea agglomerans]